MTLTPQIVKLTQSIEYMGVTYTELTFTREMRMKDMFAMDEHKVGSARTAALYASLAGVPFDVIGELTNQDMANVARAVAALSPKPFGTDKGTPKTGSGTDGTS